MAGTPLTDQPSPTPSDGQSRPHGPLMRCWLAAPDWLFRALGAALFLGLLAARIGPYWDGSWLHETHYPFPDGIELRLPWGGILFQRPPGYVLYLPFARPLIDLTYLLIALGFCFRIPPRRRADRGRDIMIALAGGFWPFLPLIVSPILKILAWLSFEPAIAWLPAYERLVRFQNIPAGAFFIGSSLIILGNALDVYGYGTLFRSLSIVPEARELKVNGPYRFIRHPIYFGQMLAQAGIWLAYAKTHIIWISFYAIFVALQLYRSRIEERVMQEAFGERYLTWKKKTFWFFASS